MLRGPWIAGLTALTTLAACAPKTCERALSVPESEITNYMLEPVGLGEKFDRFECLLSLRPPPLALSLTFRRDGVAAAREASVRLSTGDRGRAVREGMLSIIEDIAENDRPQVCNDRQIRHSLSVLSRSGPRYLRSRAQRICDLPEAPVR